MMARVQILSWSNFFIFLHTFYHYLSTILYIGFSDHLLSFLSHFLMFIVVSILKTFYVQILVLESVIFCSQYQGHSQEILEGGSNLEYLGNSFPYSQFLDENYVYTKSGLRQ